jgi:hypothetical protein
VNPLRLKLFIQGWAQWTRITPWVRGENYHLELTFEHPRQSTIKLSRYVSEESIRHSDGNVLVDTELEMLKLAFTKIQEMQNAAPTSTPPQGA